MEAACGRRTRADPTKGRLYRDQGRSESCDRTVRVGDLRVGSPEIVSGGPEGSTPIETRTPFCNRSSRRSDAVAVEARRARTDRATERVLTIVDGDRPGADGDHDARKVDRDRLVVPGVPSRDTSVIETSTWLRQAISTWSPTTTSPSPGRGRQPAGALVVAAADADRAGAERVDPAVGNDVRASR